MSEAGEKLMKSLDEALAIAKGNLPAARITIQGHTYVPCGSLQEAHQEIKRLRRDCAELYQVIGTMAEYCPDPCAPQITKALDNASDAANGDPRRHDDLLPFVLPLKAHS